MSFALNCGHLFSVCQIVCIDVAIWASLWENWLFAYAKTKTQISFAVTAKLISAFVFATYEGCPESFETVFIKTKP